MLRRTIRGHIGNQRREVFANVREGVVHPKESLLHTTWGDRGTGMVPGASMLRAAAPSRQAQQLVTLSVYI